MRIVQVVLLLLLEFIFSSLAFSSDKHYYIEQVSINEGLTQNSVKAIHRDAYGFLWIGTKNGLNRYSGVHMKNYFHNPEIANSLPGNYIYFVTTDSKGKLWVGTNKGLVNYLSNEDSFCRVEGGNDFHNSVYSNYAQTDGLLLLGSTKHVAIYSPVSNTFTFLRFKGDVTSLPLAYHMIPLNNDEVLIASRWKGLFVCDLKTGEIKKISYLQEEQITAVYIDSDKKLWVGVYKKGVYVYDDQGKLLNHYSSKNSELSNDLILSIKEINSQIWVGTDGGSVQVFNKDLLKFKDLTNRINTEYKTKLNSVSLIHKDQYGGIWLGTINGGLFGVKEVTIASYTGAPFNSRSGLSSQTVLSLCQDKTGHIWIGTDGGGINLFEPATGLFTHFISTKGKKVNAIEQVDKGELLINCYGEGLKLFDMYTHKLKPLILHQSSGKIQPGQRYFGVGLKKLHDSDLLVSEDQLHLINVKERRINTLSNEMLLQDEGELKIAGYIQGRIVFYGQKGLYAFEEKIQQLSLLKQFSGNEVIHTALYDSLSILYVSTTKALYQINILNNKTQILHKNTEQIISSIAGMMNKQLWLGVGNDLAMFDFNSGNLCRFSRSEGVIKNEYLPKSFLKAQNGDIFMGGVNGLIHISKANYKKDEKVTEFYVTNIQKEGRSLTAEEYQQFLQTKELSVPWNYKTLSFSLIAKNKDFFDETQFRYKIGEESGFSISKDTEFNMSLLSPGSYPVYVQANLKNGHWSDSHKILHLYVKQPYWKQNWFVNLTIFVLLLLVLFIWLLANKRQSNKSRLKLAEKDKLINKQKVNFFLNISHEIRTPLTLIYGPLQQLLQDQGLSLQNRSLLELMKRQINNLNSLTRQVLNLRNMNDGVEGLQIQPVSLNEWLQSMVKDFEFELEKHRVEVQWNLDESIETVCLDKRACKKVIDNFMVNAFKYASQSERFTWITRSVDDGYVEIALADEGTGLSLSDEKSVFERYYQGDKHEDGYGIGLSYSRTLIEQQGGIIGARKNYPQGSVFFFTLPLAQNNKENNSLFESDNVYQQQEDNSSLIVDQDLKNNAFKSLTILVVEDNIELLIYLKQLMSKWFSKVYAAKNGQDALEHIRKELPDMIVSDVMMPVMDGNELCRRIKTSTEISHIPVILLTAHSNEESVQYGYKMGADRYLIKPFSEDMLSDVIFNLLQTRLHLKERYHSMASNGFIDKSLMSSNADEDFICKVNNIIREELANPNLDVDLMVDKLAVSRATLYVKFKSVLGIGIKTYINNQRLISAAQLLEKTDKSISEIAELIGFQNQGYFSTLFKQFYGMSPLKYRQQHSDMK